MKFLGRGVRADVFLCEDGHVVKQFVRDSGVAYAREFRVLEAVRGRDLPIPILEDTPVIDGFNAFRFERGPIGPAVNRELVRKPWQLRRIAGELAEAHARLRTCHGVALASVREKMIGRLREAGLPTADRDLAIDWAAGAIAHPLGDDRAASGGVKRIWSEILEAVSAGDREGPAPPLRRVG